MTRTMRVITIKQPWATLIVLRHKPVENRTRGITYRGPILIHAGKQRDTGTRAQQAARRFLKSDDLPYGEIIGVADLFQVITNADDLIGDKWWFTGPVGWLLRNARQFDRTFPTRGHQGIWYCPPNLAARIKPLL